MKDLLEGVSQEVLAVAGVVLVVLVVVLHAVQTFLGTVIGSSWWFWVVPRVPLASVLAVAAGEEWAKEDKM